MRVVEMIEMTLEDLRVSKAAHAMIEAAAKVSHFAGPWTKLKNNCSKQCVLAILVWIHMFMKEV